MVERCFVHVAGPRGAGKTTFIEQLLHGLKGGVICVRAVRDDSLTEPRESADRSHDELSRYRQAGAWASASYRFPALQRHDLQFFETQVMQNFSEAVVIEGDLPVPAANLTVFVAPVPPAGARLLVRVEVAAERAASLAVWQRAVESPEAYARFVSRDSPGVAERIGAALRGELEEQRSDLSRLLAAYAEKRPSELVERWGLAQPYRGIEQAGLVVVNVRNDGEASRVPDHLEEIGRLRRDDDVYLDIVRRRGSRKAITAVAADLGNPDDLGLRKAISRVRRGVAGTRSERG
jgi:hypothetical protein